MKAEKCEVDDFNQESFDVREMINSIGSGKPVEIRAPTPKGPKITQEDIDRWNAYAEKIQNTENTVAKLDTEVD